VVTRETDAPDGTRRLLRGTELRYAVIRLLQLLGPSTIPDILDALDKWGFAVEGRPSKTVSDALRWERRRDRVRRIGWGLYRAGAMPRSTEHRIITRVTALREEVAHSRSEAGTGVSGAPVLVVDRGELSPARRWVRHPLCGCWHPPLTGAPDKG
jgi:hypothetical protein